MVVVVAACDRGPPDECEQLRPTFLSLFDEVQREAADAGPARGSSLGSPAPGVNAQLKRERAHVSKRFAGACRMVGATEFGRCLGLAKERRARPRGERPPEDPACAKLGDTMEHELYRGFE